MTALRAWKVSAEVDDGDMETILHAGSADAARQRGAWEFNTDEEVVAVKRYPRFDGLVGNALTYAMLALGWGFPCNKCGRVVYDSGLEEDDDSDWESDGPSLPSPRHLVRHGDVYCSSECCIARLRELRSYRENQWGVVADAVQRWPGIEITDSSGLTFGKDAHRNQVVGRVEFRFPGGRGSVSWCRYSPHVNVQARDVEAWEAFAVPLRSLEP